MAVPISKIRIFNFSSAATAAGIQIVFEPEHGKEIVRSSKKCPRPEYNDACISRPRVAYSDQDCDIIGNRIDNRIIFLKTLSQGDKRQFHSENIRSSLEEGFPAPTDKRLEHGVFKPGDMYALQSALEAFGFETTPTVMRELAVQLGNSARRQQPVELDPATLNQGMAFSAR